MRSDFIVIKSIGSQDAAQMRLAQDDQMIHTLAPDRSDQSFGKAVLPRRGWRRRFVPDAHGAHSSCNDGAIDPTPITNQGARSLVPGECLGELARDPFRRRTCCDVDPDQISTVQTDNDEGIEQVEANGRSDKQVHGSNVRRVVPQERPPSLTWRPASLDHVLSNARLRDLKPEFEQLAVDARRSPKRVLNAHSPDQRSEVRLDLRPPSPRTRLPTPVATKAGTMPPHEGYQDGRS